MFCTQCGSKLPDDARFCSSCGKPIGTVCEINNVRSTPNIVSLKCPDCGSPLNCKDEDTIVVCSYCGNSVRIERDAQGKAVDVKLCLVSSNLDSLLQRANDYLIAEQYAFAADLFHKVLNIDANNEAANKGLDIIADQVFKKAKALRDEGYIELAIKEYRNSLVIAPWLADKVRSKVEFLKDYPFLTLKTTEFLSKKVVSLKYDKLVVYDKRDKKDKQEYSLRYIKEVGTSFWHEGIKIKYCEEYGTPREIKLALSLDDTKVLINAIDEARNGIYKGDPRSKRLKKKIQEEQAAMSNSASSNDSSIVTDVLIRGLFGKAALKEIKKEMKKEAEQSGK